jgi:preprotein translocase subunit SecF
MRWFETPSFDFVSTHRKAYIFSAILFVASLAIILVKGLQYGIDFRGGKEFVVTFSEPIEVTDVRDALAEPLGSVPEIKKFGADTDLMIRTDAEGEINQVQSLLLGGLAEAFEGVETSVEKTYIVSPRFAEDLKVGAINSILFSIPLLVLFAWSRGGLDSRRGDCLGNLYATCRLGAL